MAIVRRSLLLAVMLGFFVSMAPSLGQRELTIRGDRWLAIAALSGPVEIVTGRGRRWARQGDRLAAVGDVIITGANASARLEVDQAVGFITVAENSRLQIQTLSITQNGGRITDLLVTRGQVRLRLRRLTNPDSRLNIHTPAGVSGVRGTDFGITVQTDGQTGVATLEGSVAASGQGRTVIVSENLQTLIRPGEPPTPPAPLQDNPALEIEELRALPGDGAVKIVGQTDRVNLLEVQGRERLLDRDGRFNILEPLLGDRRIEVTVTTPLGTEQKYQLVVP